jgi:hypothetical protein
MAAAESGSTARFVPLSVNMLHIRDQRRPLLPRETCVGRIVQVALENDLRHIGSMGMAL